MRQAGKLTLALPLKQSIPWFIVQSPVHCHGNWVVFLKVCLVPGISPAAGEKLLEGLKVKAAITEVEIRTGNFAIPVRRCKP